MFALIPIFALVSDDTTLSKQIPYTLNVFLEGCSTDEMAQCHTIFYM